MLNVIEKAVKTHDLSKEEIVSFLKDDMCNEELFKAADEVRKKYAGDEVFLRGLIEFSNYCENNCLYCGIRRDNKKLMRYRIEPDDIVEIARYAIQEAGMKTIVLQSGEDLYFDVDKISYICKQIKAMDAAITLGIGEKSFKEYEAYKKAGADRYLLRIETTDKKLYEDNDPGMSWEDRLQCLKDLKKLGYELGSGCLVGLPNQTIESLADDILFFKEIGSDMIGIGPFIPHSETPLANSEGGKFDLALKVMALTRLILPDINIPATTAMEALRPNGQALALQAGANVIMPNVTPTNFRENYQLYKGKTITGILDGIQKIHSKIESIDRRVGKGYGNSKRNLEFRKNGAGN